MANIKISELNELLPGQKAYDDYLAIVDSSADETKKISVETLTSTGVKLIAVSSTAPTEYSNGDKYYNSTTNRIYEARTDVWYNPQEPVEGIFYIIFDSQNIYTYDKENETLVSVGGGAGGGGDSTPIGTVEAYSGSTAPNGYLLCDGSAVSRTTYSDLFSVIGTTYGSGDGSTTFNLPNLKGRVVAMLDTNDTDFNTLGKTGGSKYLQKHDHVVKYNVNGLTAGGSNMPIIAVYGQQTDFKTNETGTGNSGNLQPYIVLNYIIKANKVSQVPTTAEVQNVYSTSQDDVYSCDYINYSESYSTSEVKTNKTWLGNPVYRKCFSKTNEASAQVSIGSVSNLDKLVNLTGIIDSSTIRQPIGQPNSDANYTSRLYMYGGTIYLQQGTGWQSTNYTINVIVEYTKTTD